MRLFSFKRAPNPRRVRIFLAEKGIEIPTVDVNLYRMEQLSPEFLAINPGGTVPVLETDDGLYLTECVAICRYIERLHPEPNLFGTSASAEALTLMWDNIVENEGMPAVAEVLRNLSPGFAHHVFPGPLEVEQIPELVERGRGRTEQFLDRVGQRLSEAPYLSGEEFSIADITLLATVEFATWVDIDATASRPSIADWYARVSARPSLQGR
jgi:glutathione S-transferase